MTTPRSITSGKMTINVPGVIRTLGESLYSDPSVSVRELIQNANDTCIVRQAEDPNAPPPEIHIHYDPYRRILVVEDNGAGMTAEEVEEFLTVIGSSHTDEVRQRLEAMGERSLAEQLIGRFGLGLLSAFIIGDKIEFITRSYKEGTEAIWWECAGEQEYQMGPGDKAMPGTTVTVAIKQKQVGLLKEDKLTELIHLFADLLTVPIYLDPIPRPVNVMSAPWHRDATEKEYREYLTERYPNESILSVIPIKIEEDDGTLKVGGVLFVPKQPYFIVREHGDVIVYVRRMYVCRDERTLLPDWAKFVKGVIESPNLRETTSREAIRRDENFERVQKALGRAVLDYLAQVSEQDPRLFKEIVTNHNLVIKAWAVASDELFDRIKDIVLFTTDAGQMNLKRYFEMSSYSKAAKASGTNGDKRYIFYFTTTGGIGQHAMLFAAKGLRVIDAQHFPDEPFLQKYAARHDDVVLRKLDVGGEFIFEELSRKENKWLEMEETYSRLRIDAKLVQFVPESIPAVLIFSETEDVDDQVETLLSDPNLSAPLKTLVRQMHEDRKKERRGKISAGGILYANANNSVMQQLADLDHQTDYDIQDVMIFIYNNALMLSTQGAKRALMPESAKVVFESNNRVVNSLVNKIQEVRELQKRQLVGMNGEKAAADRIPAIAGRPAKPDIAVEQTKHITCFVALPFDDEYRPVLEALRDVLEGPPYYWEVKRADERLYESNVPENVGHWIARAHCYAVDLTEGNDNVLMEVGLIHWGYADRPLILMQREEQPFRLANLGERFRAPYPWHDPPDQAAIAAALRKHISTREDIGKLKGEAHYLSTRAMRGADWIESKVARAIAEQYQTVEQFVEQDPDKVAKKLGRGVPPAVVIGIQDYLAEQCGLSKKSS